MKTVKVLVSIGVTCTLFAAVVKGFTINGTLDPGYGSALATQMLATTALKDTLGLVDQSSGSELDAAYGVVSNGVLYLFLAGNLDTGSGTGVPYDKLHVFFMSDSGAGGANTLGTNYDYTADFGAINRMGTGGNGQDTADPSSAGLTFDSGFYANYDIEVTAGATNLVTMYANYWQICPFCPSYYLGSVQPTNTPSNAMVDSSALNSGIQVALNNSNTNGVWADVNGCIITNGGSTNNPLAVTTGVEMAIPLSAIGSPQTSVSICAFITDNGCDLLYNQVLGPVLNGASCVSDYNVDGPDADSSEVNFQSFSPGKHYFTIPVPPCNSPSISFSGGSYPFSASFPSTGGTSNVTVVACSYTASTSANWVTITSGASGSSGTIDYSVGTNTSISARTASLFIVTPISSSMITQTVTIAENGVTLPPLGVITVDGSWKSYYGCPLAVQDLGTPWGKNPNGVSFGSDNGDNELDAAYGLVQNDTLFLLFTGNLQNQGGPNELHVFFMAGSGGTTNGLTSMEVTNIGANVLNIMGGSTNGAATNYPGLLFDPGFKPNYWMGVNIGSPYRFYLDYAQLWPGGTNALGIATNGYNVGSSVTLTNGTLIPGAGGLNGNPFGIQATIDDSNTNGVAGDNNGCVYSSEAPDLIITNSVFAQQATTGVELAIPLAALGSPTGAIGVCAFIGNYNGAQPGSYISNQLLPPINPIGTTNSSCYGPLATGNSKKVNFGALPGGPHFFTVGPEMRVTGVVYAVSGGATNVSVTVLPENNTNISYRLQRTFAPLTSTSTWANVTGSSPANGGPSVITFTDTHATNKVGTVGGILYRVQQTPACGAP